MSLASIELRDLKLQTAIGTYGPVYILFCFAILLYFDLMKR